MAAGERVYIRGLIQKAHLPKWRLVYRRRSLLSLFILSFVFLLIRQTLIPLARTSNRFSHSEDPGGGSSYTLEHGHFEIPSRIRWSLNTSKWERNMLRKVLHLLSTDDLFASLSSSVDRDQALISFAFPKFAFTEPRFAHEVERTLFLSSEGNKELMETPSKDKLTGSFAVIEDGFVHETFDCGWGTDMAEFRFGLGRKNQTYQLLKEDFFGDSVIIPILVPDSFSFQHFLDGAMPKIAQSITLIKLLGLTILTRKPREHSDAILYEMFQKIGIATDKLIFIEDLFGPIDLRVAPKLALKHQINTCICPPVHPDLFRRSRELLGVKDELQREQPSLVILLVREIISNPGRTMVNKQEVVHYLRSRYGRERFVVFRGGLNLSQSLELFQRAGLVIGVHGGAFYNINFAPRSANVVEIMPHAENDDLPNLSNRIVWMMSQMIGQKYWRMSTTQLNDLDDVRVPMDKLEDVLDRIEPDL